MRAYIFLLAILFTYILPGHCQQWVWLKTPVTGPAHSVSIATDKIGNVYSAGIFGGGSITLGTYTLNSTGTNNSTYFYKADSSGTILWAKSINSTVTVDVTDITVDTLGNVYLIGTYGGVVSFGIATFNNPTTWSFYFIAKYDTNGNILWVKQASGSGGTTSNPNINVVPEGISVKNGTVTVCGEFSNTATFSGNSFTSVKGLDAFVIRYSDTGNILWIKTPGDQSDEYAYDVATDKAGNSYVCGIKGNNLNFGGPSLGPNGFQDMFLVKYDNNGNALWARAGQCTNPDYAYSVAADENNDAYVSGVFKGTISFGSGISLTDPNSSTFEQSFLVKYSSAGVIQWARTNSNWSERGLRVRTSPSGFIYWSGRVPLIASAMFITKYNAAGDSLWSTLVNPLGGESSIYNFDAIGLNKFIATDYFNDIYVAASGNRGEQFGTINFPNTVHTKYLFLGKISECFFLRNLLTDISQCTAANATISLNPYGAGLNFQWYRNNAALSNAGNISGAQSPDLSISSMTGADGGNYYCAITSSCSHNLPINTDTFAINIISSVPGAPGTITGNLSPCLGQNSYSVSQAAGISYIWSVTGGSIISSGQGSAIVNWTAAGTQTLKVTPSNACGTGTASSLNVTVGTVPAQPSAIAGNATPCIGSSSYSVTPVAGVNYNWTATGGTVTSSSNGNATVNWTSTGNKTLTVTPSNTCGNGAASSLAVTVATIPSQPPVISGSTTSCIGTSSSYSFTPLTSGVTYTWSVTGGTVTSSSGGNATINWTIAGTQTITVTPSNTCGTGQTRTLSVIVGTIPSQPSAISGNINPCRVNSLYSVTAVAGVTYSWIPTGGTVVSSSGGNATINWNTPGSQTLTVTPTNNCGSGTPSSLNITVNTVPSQPSNISGNANPCLGSSSYSVTLVAGVNYTWSATGGSITSIAENATVNWTAAGNKTLTVTPSNTCGNGASSSLAVTVSTIPSQPPAISGSTNPCLGTSSSYSFTPATAGITYSWSVTSGTVVNSSGGNATINWTGTGTQTITVTPSNTCGAGPIQSLPITVNDVPSILGNITGGGSPCVSSTQSYSVAQESGVTYTWNVQGGTIVTANQNTASVSWQNSGNQTITVMPSNICGNGSDVSRIINVVALPTANAGNDTTINNGSSIILDGCCGSTNSYSWNPSDFLDNPSAMNPKASPSEDIIYTLTVTDSNGCSSSSSVSINVNAAYKLFIPNMFSPNGDGNNETFKIYGFGIKNILFEIYNKWGEKVYSTSDPDQILNAGWDGTHNRELQPAGAYVWKVGGEFLDGTELNYDSKKSGTVLLTK